MGNCYSYCRTFSLTWFIIDLLSIILIVNIILTIFSIIIIITSFIIFSIVIFLIIIPILIIIIIASHHPHSQHNPHHILHNHNNHLLHNILHSHIPHNHTHTHNHCQSVPGSELPSLLGEEQLPGWKATLPVEEVVGGREVEDGVAAQQSPAGNCHHLLSGG